LINASGPVLHRRQMKVEVGVTLPIKSHPHEIAEKT